MNIFQEFHIDKNDKEDHFNFFKFYLINYYMNFVKLYNSVCNYDSDTATEMLHNIQLRIFTVT